MSRVSTPLPADFFGSANARIVLAPMEGVVDHITREILTSIGGIDLCVTEFIRVVDQLLPEHVFLRDAPELAWSELEPACARSHTRSGVPLLVQLLGSDPVCLGENAARAIDMGAVGVDLNFGCPAKTVNRHDGGATLLKNPERVRAAVEGVRRAVPATHTVSAKVRLGFSDKSLCREIAQAAQAGGASWLTVHARTRDEGYQPPAHWEFIAQMRECVSIPVIANGDVWTPDDYQRMLAVSGSRHAMLGRGLLARPSLALECRRECGPRSRTTFQNQGDSDFTWNSVRPHVDRFFAMSLAERGPRFASARIKQWLRSLALTYPEARELFDRVKVMQTVESIGAV